MLAGNIFTAGARDKLVKAFFCKREKVECSGKIKIPEGLGSATCVVAIGNMLFVGTERNSILTVATDNLRSSDVISCKGSPQLPLASSHKALQFRTQSNPAFAISKAKNQGNKAGEENSKESKTVFTAWETAEVARGFGSGGVCVCPINLMQYKPRKRKSK